ncbi:CDF family cation diffusion facilitator [Paucilactobacillus suebicus DSM 5007 = KCTC 3549]|uniref:CDF family cation diffusion facilitator n=1 Tax=Paucilactobacillus suebicus DSM 5007 = KCTC 3549 TaxID=1423807 RepID=A0A0R1W6U3_9LACO|nr:CDF family cation diffusion facilitator [Paucilactobacillus suebicus DSM 5007 = KCTC 3549]
MGGVFSGSLALLSDAFHNLGDSAAILLGYFAQLIGRHPETERRTYGYRRAEIIFALLNSIFLIVISVFLIFEAAKRFSHPQPINGELMLIVAVVGLLANLASAFLLQGGSKDSLNIKATYLHILSDALSSVGVIIGALFIWFTDISWIDPVITILVAIYICYETWPIIHQTLSILMQSSPELDYACIKKDIKQIDGITGVHHVHAWMIDEHRIIFSVHINLKDMKLSEVEPIYQRIETLLKNKYHICHITIQAEVERGIEETMFNTPADKATTSDEVE